MRSFQSFNEQEILALAISLEEEDTRILMTTVGGLGRTLPYLIPDIKTATAVAVAVVLVELAVISWIRHRFMDTSLASALFQVVIGGLLVFLTDILIGCS
jgi:hypothetical protein